MLMLSKVALVVLPTAECCLSGCTAIHSLYCLMHAVMHAALHLSNWHALSVTPHLKGYENCVPVCDEKNKKTHIKTWMASNMLLPSLLLLQDQFQTQSGSPTNLYIRDVDISLPFEQAKMFAAINATLDLPTINATLSALVPSWLMAFTYFCQMGPFKMTMDNSSHCFNPYTASWDSGEMSGR